MPNEVTTASKLVGRENYDPASLNAAKKAIEHRLEVDKASFQTLEDFQRFIDTRANTLKHTQPRPVKVFNPDEELANLFDELVAVKTSRSSVHAPGGRVTSSGRATHQPRVVS